MIRRDDLKMEVSFTTVALKLKTDALELSGLIARVSTPEEQATAVQAQIALKDILSRAEKSRAAAKAPVLEFGKRIDDAAKTFKKELDEEMYRVTELVSDYQQLEQKKAQAEQIARNAEASKLEQEKATQIAQATSHEAIDAIEQHFNEKAAVLASAPVAAPPRIEGQRVTVDWEIQVVNPFDLARFHPSCVKIEPKLLEIKALLNAGIQVKGVTAKKVTKSTVSAGRPRPAIEA